MLQTQGCRLLWGPHKSVMSSARNSVGRVLSLLIGFLVVSAIYLYTFPQANIFYAGVVLLHVVAGVVASVLLLLWLVRSWRQGEPLVRIGMAFLFLGAIPGLALIYTGALRAEWPLVYIHLGLSFVGAGLIAAARMGHHGWLSRHAALRVAVVLAVLAVLAPVARYLRETRWTQRGRIENPALPPVSMNGEGDGPTGPFFPSSAQVYGGEKIPSKFFMESDSCKRCHEDIYNQWNSSAHHFSSFNNQWYRKAVEYMQDTVGTRPSKWCGGCHDPAVLYSGKMDTPIKQIVHTPEAQAGLGCMMCHSIADVKSTMGQGDFYLEYPKLHELAASKNPLVRTLHDFMIKLNPEPHRRVFLKPFMKQQTAEFCSSCHKVHLDVPVNHYRWIRGFNEYDNWQASGVSGEGARSFYYPPKPQQCADCHMPLEPSNDMGNIAGKVHSHRFPAANTALPTANEDAAQLKATEEFLTSGALTVDIFALTPASTPLKTGAIAQHELATTFAVGEEAEAKITPGPVAEAAPVTAPLDRVRPAVRRGDTVRVDVVVRTKRVGHFFPGGTVDAYDTWLELKGVDDKGQTIFWSGMVEDNGKGPVDKGAHFYRSLQVDAHGNPINKRNAWATRAVVYVRLIPPGAADTVHFRMKIPEKTGSKITLTARLCYRKFAWWNTQFAFAGEHDNSAIEARRRASHGYARLRRYENGVHGVSPRSLGEIREDSRRTDRGSCAKRSSPRRTARERPGAAVQDSARKRRLAALERLRHRPLSARRSESRAGCLRKSHRDRSTESRWLGKHRTRRSAGRRRGPRPHRSRESAWLLVPISPARTSSMPEFCARKAITTARHNIWRKSSRNIPATAWR